MMPHCEPLSCWKCGASVEVPGDKLGFQAICEGCFAWLHSCKGCRHYTVGLPNHCKIPGTEWIADREARNFCDEFQPLLCERGQTTQRSSADVAKELFGDVTEEEKDNDDGKNPFERLFGD